MTRRTSTQLNSAELSRRSLLFAASAAAFGATIVPRHVLGGAGHTAPSDRLNVAGIGAGGMGGGDIATVARLGANIVALCDVDEQRAAGSFNAFPKARQYKDFREHARQGSEEHRCRHGGNARPCSRRRCDGRHSGRQTRLLPEASDSHPATNAAN